MRWNCGPRQQRRARPAPARRVGLQDGLDHGAHASAPSTPAAGAQQAVLQLLGIVAEARWTRGSRRRADRARRCAPRRSAGPAARPSPPRGWTGTPPRRCEWVTKMTVSFFSLPQLEQVAVELVARDLVERAEGLVHQQQRGLRDQAARDRHAHLHAARQLARQVAGELVQARPAPARRARAASASARGTPARSSGSRTLACTRAQGISVGSWKTKDRRWPVLSICSTGLRHSSRRPLLGSQQAGDHLQQRALAAARRAEQRDELAFLHRQVDRLQRMRAVRVGLLDRQHLDRWHGRRARSCLATVVRLYISIRCSPAVTGS